MSDTKYKKVSKMLNKRSGDPANKELYNRVKSEAKKKFAGDWPSAYGSAWLQKEYQKRGGKYK